MELNYFIYEIFIDGVLIQLCKPIELKIYRNDSKYIIESDTLNLFTISLILQNGIEEIKWQIGSIYKGYVQEDPDRLTDKAKEYAEQIKKIVQVT